jgi:hypothetical protein
MTGKLPKRLMLGLGAGAALFLMFGVYVETFQLEVLQDHPILTNLLSGLIAFPCATLAIALGLNWFVQREQLVKLRAIMPEAWRPIARYWTRVWAEENEDLEDLEVDEGGRFSDSLGVHEEMIKFHIPLAVYLLGLQDDFLVISHLRLAEERCAALAALPPPQDTVVRRAEMSQLTDTILNLVKRIATSENGCKLDLPKTIPDVRES